KRRVIDCRRNAERKRNLAIVNSTMAECLACRTGALSLLMRPLAELHLVPLTPALSPGERENLPLSSGRARDGVCQSDQAAYSSSFFFLKSNAARTGGGIGLFAPGR